MVKIDDKQMIQYNQLILKENQKAEIELKISEADLTILHIIFKDSGKEEKEPSFELKNNLDGSADFIFTDWDSTFRAAQYKIGTSDDGKKIYAWILVQSIGALKKIDLEFLMEL